MTPFAAMLVCFVLLVALSCPLSFSMLLSCALYLILSGNSLTLLVQQLFSGLDIFTIMAIPFFMLAGDLMVASGTAESRHWPLPSLVWLNTATRTPSARRVRPRI